MKKKHPLLAYPRFSYTKAKTLVGRTYCLQIKRGGHRMHLVAYIWGVTYIPSYAVLLQTDKGDIPLAQVLMVTRWPAEDAPPAPTL